MLDDRPLSALRNALITGGMGRPLPVGPDTYR
jgi:hypothetical protein